MDVLIRERAAGYLTRGLWSHDAWRTFYIVDTLHSGLNEPMSAEACMELILQCSVVQVFLVCYNLTLMLYTGYNGFTLVYLEFVHEH